MLKITLTVLVLCIASEFSRAATFGSGLLCYKDSNYKIDCKDKKIFIASVRYENDYDSYCSHKLTDFHFTTSGDRKKCHSTNAEILRRQCNGKTACDISLFEKVKFSESDTDSNCDFQAERLHINYECINDNTDDKTVARFDICGTPVIQHKPDGFITSPNYPNQYNSRQYCQLKLKLSNNESERLEIYLIDMQMEKTSMWNANPTDYLEINNNGKLFLERAYELVFNESSDALLVFKTDNFFNKRGFLLYFKVVQIVIPTTTTTTTTTTTYTTEVVESDLASNETQYDSIEDINDENEDIEVMSTPKSIILSTIAAEAGSSFMQIDSQFEEVLAKKDEKRSNNLAFYILIGCICMLTIVVIAIFATRRYIGRNGEIKERILSNNSSARTSTATSHTGSEGTQQYADDSMAHLLLNSSAINSTQLEAFYEDVTGTLPRDLPPLPPLPHQTSSKLLEMSMKSDKANGYINDVNRSSFRNEYCYIPASNLNEKCEKSEAVPEKAPQNIYITNSEALKSADTAETIKEETSDEVEKEKIEQPIGNSDAGESNYYVVPSNMPVVNAEVC